MKHLILLAFIATFASCTSSHEPTATESTESKPMAKEDKAVSNDHINWMSFEEAQDMNTKSPRKVIVDVYTPWCGPCKMMERSTFQDPGVIQHINENYYAVKFNGESGADVHFKGRAFSNPDFDATRPENRRNSAHQLTSVLGISGYPTLVVFDPQFNKITDIVGYRNPEQLMSALGQVN